MEKTQKMNKMGTEKISRLLLTMGVPMIISMVGTGCVQYR